jgi:hypothetical protein
MAQRTTVVDYASSSTTVFAFVDCWLFPWSNGTALLVDWLLFKVSVGR